MSKHIITEKKLKALIKENVRTILCEFMQDGFSFEKMDSINPNERMEYCKQYLGEPITEPGSSRCVFEIDDSQVLKIAYGRKFDAGCKQNNVEYNMNRKFNTPILVKTLYHANDYSWIISEKVIPCKQIDFYKILGLPYIPYTSEKSEEDSYNMEHKDLLDYNDYKTEKINDNDRSIGFTQVKQVMKQLIKGYVKPTDFPTEYKIITTNPWFKDLYTLATEHDLDLDDVSLANMGITLRNGKPTIVLLDTGLTNEVWNNYY